MLAKKVAAAACVAASLFLSLPAYAQSLSVPAERLVERYTELAGSDKNAQALVTGLRDGSEITLKSDSSTVTIDPPTRKMGYGNVDNALALAEASLKGIAEPTPEQLKAALLGGSVTTDSGTTVKLDGVLQMRADGMGWGQIANSLGIRLGDVKRSERAPERVARAAKPMQVEKPQRPDKPELPARPDRPQRHGR